MEARVNAETALETERTPSDEEEGTSTTPTTPSTATPAANPQVGVPRRPSAAEASNYFDWDRDGRLLVPCGMWNCPIDSHLSPAATFEMRKCRICLRRTPNTAMLACWQCGQRTCVLCKFREMETVTVTAAGPRCAFCRRHAGTAGLLFLHLVADRHANEIGRPANRSA